MEFKSRSRQADDSLLKLNRQGDQRSLSPDLYRPRPTPEQVAHQQAQSAAVVQASLSLRRAQQEQQRQVFPQQLGAFTRLAESGQAHVQRQQQRIAPVMQAAELRRQDDLAVQRTQDQLSTAQHGVHTSSRTLAAYGLAPADPLDVIQLQREEARQIARAPVAPLPLSTVQRQALMQHATDEISSALTRDARYLPASGRADVAHAAVQRFAEQGLDQDALRGVMVQRAPDENTRESVNRLLIAQHRQETQAQEDREERGLLLGHHGLQRQLQEAQADHDAEQSHSLSERIQARQGAGQPLPTEVRRQLELGLNADLSRVRIHDDSEADKLAKSLQAVAFTSGQDIFFRAGKYQPGTPTGFALLLHEGTHTVQQARGQAKPGIDADPGLEQEAVANEGKVAEVTKAQGASPERQSGARQAVQPRPAVQRKAASAGDVPVQRLADTPPSWQVTATSEQLEGMVHTQLPTLLRNIQMGMMLDQGYYQSRNRGRQVPITPSGQIFLDTLDHLPLSAASKISVLQAAIEGPHLPDTVRSDLIQAALSAGRIQPAQAKKVLSAIDRKKTDVDQISDFGAAVVSRAWDSVLGLLKAAKFIAWDVSSVRMTIDPVGYGKTITTSAQSLQAIVDHPGLLWEALTADIKDAWKKGEYGKSLGYITFDVGTLALGVPSAVRGGTAAAGRVAGATRVQLMVFKTKAGELSTTLSQMSDDLAQVAGAGLQGPRLAEAGTGGRVAGRSADQMTAVRRQGGVNQDAVKTAAAKTLLGDLPANWPDVRGLIGKPLRINDLPRQYSIGGSGDLKYIVRKPGFADDRLVTPLTVDHAGLVQIADPARLSNPAAMSRNYKQSWGDLPGGHWIHHLLPDNLIRNTPLGKLLQHYGYDLDRGSNLLPMPAKDAYLAGMADNPDLIGHWSSHDKYDAFVRARFGALYVEFQTRYGNLNALSPEAVKVLMQRIERLELELKTRIKDGGFERTDKGTLASQPAQGAEV